jgi:hypothetical protein
MPHPLSLTLTSHDPRPAPRALGLACALVASTLAGCSNARRSEPALLGPAAQGAASEHPDVRLLASRDFVERSRAAERLVAGGAASLPALGRAGDFGAEPFARGTGPLASAPDAPAESTTRPVIDAILARLSPAEVEEQLASPWPVLRRGAADELGRRGDWSPIPRLIDRLEDPVPQVRDAAHAALRRLTNEFVETGGRTLASGAVAERWRTWWRQEGRAKATTGSPNSG